MLTIFKEDDLYMQRHKDAMRNLVEQLRSQLDMPYGRNYADLLNSIGVSDEELIWCDAFNEYMLKDIETA